MFKNVVQSPIRVIANLNLHRAVAKSKSKPKKAKSPRAQFYSALMKNLGGQTGDDLGAAFTANEHDKFRKMMQDLADKMADVEVKDKSKSKSE